MGILLTAIVMSIMVMTSNYPFLVPQKGPIQWIKEKFALAREIYLVIATCGVITKRLD